MTTISSIQISREDHDFKAATAKLQANVLDTMNKGREYDLEYGRDIINVLWPYVGTYYQKLSGRSGNNNITYKVFIKPLLSSLDSDIKRKELLDQLTAMVCFILTSNLSDILPLTKLATSMQKSFFSVVKAEYNLRSEYNEQVIRFFSSMITEVSEQSGVFVVENEGQNGRSPYIIRPSDKYAEIILEGQQAALSVEAQHFRPLVALPKPHTDLVSGQGGFHSVPSPIMKWPLRSGKKVNAHIANCTSTTAPFLFETINKIQNTPYTINSKVYAVICDFKDRGLHFNGYAFDESQVREKCEEAASIVIEELNNKRKDWAIENDEEYKPLTSYTEQKILKEELTKGREEVNRTLTLLEAAGSDLLEDTLYFSLFMDKRGRRYNYASNLNYQGCELSKALVQFKNTEPFTRNGLKNMFIALGNALDFGKYHKRVRLTKAKEWWTIHLEDFKKGNYDVFVNEQDKFDEPINALAITLELMAYIDDHSYQTGYILHNDARNSGPSIISTVMNDAFGMRLTSVLEDYELEDKLQDAYMITCDLALQKCIAQKGDEVIDKLLEYKDVLFTRKAFKNPTMTRGGYGATDQTIRDKVNELFIEHRLNKSKGFTQAHRNAFSGIMLEALDTSLPACSEWLKTMREVASDVVKNNNGIIEFTNPLTGMGCAWRYTRNENKHVKVSTPLRSFDLVIKKFTDKTDAVKTSNSMGANITHHLDSTILLMVQQLVSFDICCIHDSLGVLPSQVDELRLAYNKVILILNRSDIVNDILSHFTSVRITKMSDKVYDQNAILNSVHSIS